MALFLTLAAVMLAAALAIVLRPLLSNKGPNDPAAAARRRLQALNEAHAVGILDDAEFAAKRAALGDELLTTVATAQPRSRTAFASALAVALVVPIAALVLYRVVGNPRALDPAAMSAPPPAQAEEGHGQDMQGAIAGLAEKLKQNPNDVEGWALLGRAYLETQRFAEAKDALKHAHDLAADDADISVAYAEALTLSSADHQFDAQARGLVESALKTDPKNQRGIWLLGIADYQAGKYDAAIAGWNRLLEQLPKDSTIAQSVRDQIARAEADRDGRAPPPSTARSSAGTASPARDGGAQNRDTSAGAAGAAPNAVAGGPMRTTDSAGAASAAAGANRSGANGASAGGNAAGLAAAGGASPPGNGAASSADGAAGASAGPHLTVHVTLDPTLTTRVTPADTVFVYAKAAAGPPMPLAVQRLHADQLPATVVLTDGMGMMPSMKLSQFPQVVVGARISKSGNAIAQSGDLQTVSKPVDVASTAPINLKIDQTVP